MTSTKTLSTAFQKLEKLLPRDQTKRNEPLSEHTYFKLGGPADLFTIAKSAQELEQAARTADSLKIPWFVLGGGSNILVGDLGIRGLVMKNEAKKLSVIGHRLAAESGATMASLVSFAIKNGLSGLEPFMSLPGTVGGAIYNNSHYRPEEQELIGNIVESAEIYLHGKMETVSSDWFHFKYDYSRLQEMKALVLSVTFLLRSGKKELMRKRALEMVKRRNDRQPVGLACSGCMFQNAGDTPASKLIDMAGLKSTHVGGAFVSEKHANFIINDGSATVRDVLELIALVRKTVKEKFGVDIKPEIGFVGEFSRKPDFRQSDGQTVGQSEV